MSADKNFLTFDAMLKIGITGGIGSGKTTVCRIFEALDIPVYYADDRAKWLMVNNQQLVSQIKQLLGEQAYLEDGRLDRAYIASVVFQDQEKLSALNQIVHPAVHQDGVAWHAQQKDVPYTLKEAALLFESGGDKMLDKIITVAAPLALRIQRVMKRDQVDENAVMARIDKQWPESDKVERSDFVINNDENASLILQILDIHRQLKTFSHSKG